MLESWVNRRKNVRLVAEVVRLVAEVVGDRKGQISRSKVVVMFKTRSHRSVRPGYDLPATEKCWNRGPIVERRYDWSQRSYGWWQRSWVIARGKSVAARSWSCSKPGHTRLTTRLRPTCDRKMSESWANRIKHVRLVAEVVRLVAEVVGDRNGQISRSKVVVMFKTQSHRAYDQVTTYVRSKMLES